MWWYASLPAYCTPSFSCFANPLRTSSLSIHSGILQCSIGTSPHSVTAPTGNALATALLNALENVGASGDERKT